MLPLKTSSMYHSNKLAIIHSTSHFRLLDHFDTLVRVRQFTLDNQSSNNHIPFACLLTWCEYYTSRFGYHQWWFGRLMGVRDSGFWDCSSLAEDRRRLFDVDDEVSCEVAWLLSSAMASSWGDFKSSAALLSSSSQYDIFSSSSLSLMSSEYSPISSSSNRNVSSSWPWAITSIRLLTDWRID